MKKLNVLQSFILLFCISMALISCSKDKNVNTDIQTNQEFLSNLNNFNNSYNYEVSNNVGNKKWWQTVLQVAAVASGDAMEQQEVLGLLLVLQLQQELQQRVLALPS